MNKFRALNWPLVIGLGVFGLVRPVARIIFDNTPVPTPVVALTMTALVTVIWVLVLGLVRSVPPLLSGIVVGLVYALGAILLGAVLSPLLHGRLEGPLSNPIAIVPMLVTNSLWGAVVGGLAMVVHRLRWGTWDAMTTEER